jgi:thioredoxin 1
MRMNPIAIIAAILLTRIPSPAQVAFEPLMTWTTAVANGDRAALSKLYSSTPEAVTLAGKDRTALKDELDYWAGVKHGTTGFKPRLLEITRTNGNTRLLLRISATTNASHLLASIRQVWAQQQDGWKIISSVRSASFTTEAVRTLPQPATPNVSLYSDPREAEGELRAGLSRAAREKKRVLVVFGGNWCYDCHVLDATFHSKAFAPLVDANYVVIHINIGEDGKDNNDLAARLGVKLDKGVPSLGVLEPDGKIVYGQQNGEFEATEKIGAKDVRAFLEKWKLRRG